MLALKNNIFIKSTIILIIGGFITKIISMFIKIVLARLLGSEGMGLYMMISPSFMLLLAISSLGFPVAISKIVAENGRNNKNLIFSIIPVSLFINIIMIIFMLLLSNYISNNLLKDNRCTLALICIGFVLPFVSISSIIRGYFFGKQKMIPHVISNITEDIVRLICIVIGIPIFISYGIKYAVAFVILTNIISEITSIFILLFFLPKSFKIYKTDLKVNKTNIKDVFNIGIPATLSRLIGTIGFFFEPVILNYFLLKNGYSNNYIINEYGIINGFIMPLVLLPSFFTMAISQALLPNISNAYYHKKKKYIKNKIKMAIASSLLIGLPATIAFVMFPNFIIDLIYNISKGKEYLIVLAPICLFHYIQSPLTSSLQAMNRAKEAAQGTLIGTIFRIITLIIFCNMNMGMWALIWSNAINILTVTIHQYKCVKKALK